MSLRYTNPIYQVVVDNSPVPLSKEIFEDHNWTYIHNPKNPGFGASHNVIFDQFSNRADYHLIVNPDITFSSDVVKELMSFLDQNAHAGVVMPKVYYSDGRIQRLAKLLPSPLDLIRRRIPISQLQKNINKRMELHLANYNSGIFRAPFLSGCFLLFRVKCLNQIGCFDERFFMYMEDTDLTRRLWENKTYPYYYGLTSITHGYVRGSSKNWKLFKIHVLSAIKYFNKWGWYDKRRGVINKECLRQFTEI